MARLPVPGGDAGDWGTILNDFLGVEHNSDGTLKPSGSLASKADDTAVVHNTGAETIAGTKTFSAPPVVPTPTNSTHATTKQYVDDAIAAVVGVGTFRHSQTWTVGGYVNVPIGDVDYINPIFVSVISGQTLKLVAARHRINSGTNATIKLQKNGSDVTGFTGLSVTTTSTTTDPADVTLADGDMLQLVVTAISGAPQNMSFTLYFETAV